MTSAQDQQLWFGLLALAATLLFIAFVWIATWYAMGRIERPQPFDDRRDDLSDPYDVRPTAWDDMLRQLREHEGVGCECGSEHLPGNRSERGGAGDVPAVFHNPTDTRREQ